MTRRVPDRVPQGRYVCAYTWWRTEYRRLSDAAIRLHVEATMWSHDALSDGRVTLDDLVRLSYVDDPKGTADELTDAKVWEVDGDGWNVDPNRGQQSRSDVEHRLSRKSRNLADWRARQLDAESLADELGGSS